MVFFQLQVDGVALASVGIEESLLPDQSHIQPKYVIGGRWFGTNQKYTDFFNGKLSQFIFTRSVVEVSIYFESHGATDLLFFSILTIACHPIKLPTAVHILYSYI